MEYEDLRSATKTAIYRATEYAWDRMHADGHWCSEISGNVTVTAEHLFLYASLGQLPPFGFAPFQHYMLSQQNTDGSWGLAPSYPGDVSSTCEAYLALKICGVSSSSEAMRKAKAFVLSQGGVATVRMFTRIFLAMFGLLPWSSVPQLPVEIFLLPSWCPINIYNLASWARSTVVPLLLIRHHEPVYTIPGADVQQSSWLDDLWLDADNKTLPPSAPMSKLWNQGFFSVVFGIGDKILSQCGWWKNMPLRGVARRRCIDWILEHQEKQGDWAGIAMPMVCSIQALLLEGYKVNDSVIQRGLVAIERFAFEDKAGRRMQACVSPHWDTVLMVTAICDTVTIPPVGLRQCVKWAISRQLLAKKGDWRVYNPRVMPGGFSFEYNNTWYPDVDDTAATILAMLKYDPELVRSDTVFRAINWILGMQCKDGGWAAFDTNNDKLWLNKLPFSDMDALCDPPSADITGRVLEALGLAMDLSEAFGQRSPLLDRVDTACNHGIAFLSQQQETNGSWFGRWGCNYIYGTSAVVCGLERFTKSRDDVRDMVDAGIEWLKSAQNEDGGWGESLMTYQSCKHARCGASTASQTAWALMGLLAQVSSGDESVVIGIKWLLRSQTDVSDARRGASWAERLYTGTGFPRHFYFGYGLYRHYFPMMALGRYLKTMDDTQSCDSGVAGLG